MTLETHHWEGDISLTVMWKIDQIDRAETEERRDTCFLLCITLKQTLCVCVSLSVLYPPFVCFSLFSLASVQSVLLSVSSLPGHQKEDAADSQVGQKHEEPDTRREGIQEGEVAWPTSLKHTHTHTHIHSSGLKSLKQHTPFNTLISCSIHNTGFSEEVRG